MLVLNISTMTRVTSLSVLLATALAAAFAIAAEPGGGVPDAADALLGDIEKAQAQAAAQAAATRWPKWDGKESVADYAKRAGIKDVQMELDLGSGVAMKLTLIPAGKFIMGARDNEFAMIEGVRTLVREHEEGAQVCEVPQREVTISQPFYMGVYEVTQEQYLQIMKQIRIYGHRTLQSEGKTLPVDAIPWVDAAEFCKELSALTGRTVTLPTEAQWEYACRAGSKTRFYFGDDDEDLYKYANYNRKSQWAKRVTEHDDGFDGLAPVGSFKPNNFGLYDMHGNVAEHCSDWMGDDVVSGGQKRQSYKNAGTLDPTGPEKTWPGRLGYYHVWRGGSWGDAPAGCRSAARPYHAGDGFGFRVAVALK